MYASAAVKERINDILCDLKSESLQQYPNEEIKLPKYMIEQIIDALESAKREMSTLESASSWR